MKIGIGLPAAVPGTARADTLTTTEQLGTELTTLQAAGATDVILYPTSPELEQIGLLAEALAAAGFSPSRIR